MKLFFLFLIIIITSCSKPKTVLICGDHVCVNKAEAEQFFEDNLSIEVKIIDRKNQKEVDLLELNLNKSSNGDREVAVLSKQNTSQEIKVLSNKEIEITKKKIKERRKSRNKEVENVKIDKKQKINKNKQAKLNKNSKDFKKFKKPSKSNKSVNKKTNQIVDICTIVKNCSIEEISKYLIKKGNNMEFPDITSRE